MEEEKQVYSSGRIAEGARYLNEMALNTAAASTVVTAAFSWLSHKFSASGPLVVFGSATCILLAITAFNAWHCCHYSRHRPQETYNRVSYRCREALIRKMAGPIIAIAAFGASAFCQSDFNATDVPQSRPPLIASQPD